MTPQKNPPPRTKAQKLRSLFAVVSILTGIALCVYFFGPFAKQTASAKDDAQSGVVVATCDWEGSGSYSTSGKGELLMSNATSTATYSWRNIDLKHSNGPQLYFYASNNDASFNSGDVKTLTTANGGRVLEGTSSFALPKSHQNPFAMLNYCDLGFLFGKCTLQYL